MVQSQRMLFFLVIDGQEEEVDDIRVPTNFLMESIKSFHLKRKAFKLEALMAMWKSKLDTLMVSPWTVVSFAYILYILCSRMLYFALLNSVQMFTNQEVCMNGQMVLW